MSLKPTITFDKSLVKGMLGIFNTRIDDEGYVIDRYTRKRILAFDDKEFTMDEFAGIVKGKNGELIFLKGDIGSLIEAKEMGLL